jgi:glc operon protein GlcG
MRFRLALPFLLLSLGIANAQLATKKALTLDAAKQIAAAANAEAKKSNLTMVIAIVDDGGHLIYLEKMDGTQLGSVLIAQEKAAGAVRFKRPTKVMEDQVAGGRNAVLALPGVVPIEGGLPIMHEGQLIGAIGASGGTSQQDGVVAAAGLAVADKMK